MAKASAALLVYRTAPGGSIEVLLVHPGGPFWAKKDAGTWSLPKGEYEPAEEALAAAVREFREEVGVDPPPGQRIGLGELRQPGGKRVTAWAIGGDIDLGSFNSNTFEMEWPRGSGRLVRFPEVDRAAWFSLHSARSKLLRGQAPFVDRLLEILDEASPRDPGDGTWSRMS